MLRGVEEAAVGEERARRRAATGLGLLSIALWATTVSVARSAATRLGLFPAGALVFGTSGALLVITTCCRLRTVRWSGELSRRHLARCGPLFVLYVCLLYAALALARSDRDAVVAGLANYIWPTMALLFSVMLLRLRPRAWLLGCGVFLALAGIALAACDRVGGVTSLLAAVRTSPWAIAVGLLAGMSWGLYSALASRYRQRLPAGAIGIYLLAAGGILAVFASGSWGTVVWTSRALAEAGYLAVVPTAIAYVAWDVAMRDGNVPLLGSVANLTPVLATATARLYLGVPLAGTLLVGASLVAAGAALSHAAFRGATARG